MNKIEIDDEKLNELIRSAVSESLHPSDQPEKKDRASKWYLYLIQTGVSIAMALLVAGFQTSAANSARDVKIQDLDRRINLLESNSESKDDFQAFKSYLTESLNEIKDDLKQMRGGK